jgi:Leucine-rich repeat (LRR) protein
MKKRILRRACFVLLAALMTSAYNNASGQQAPGSSLITMTTVSKEMRIIIDWDSGTILTIDWGDGIKEEFIAGGDFSHIYQKSFTYKITITGANITSLEFRERCVTNLDVSKCTSLKFLYCSNNYLTSLDVSKNTALETLECYNNRLTSLDVSKNTALKTLQCSYNRLTSIEKNKNTALERLRYDEDKVTLTGTPPN